MKANHIHANLLDVLSPLRIAQLRFDEGLRAPLEGAAATPLAEAAHALPGDEFADRVELLLARAQHENNLVMDLNANEIATLGPCLLEAIATAYREGFSSRHNGVIETMSALYNEINSGRKPVILVFGTCCACWPERS